MSTIAQVVNVNKTMTTLKKGVHASGLEKMLSETGPFTVFAPSDQAFGTLDEAVLESLLEPESKAKLIDVLNLHIVSGKIQLKDLRDGEKLTTVNGRELKVKVNDGTVSIDGANVQGLDVQTSNGLIYALDAVMMRN
ncbi:fasciclin domain-containing protein [Flavitalea flava]